MLRIVFLGSDPIALPALNWLQTGAGQAWGRVVGVFTQPDRAAGRGQQVRSNEIKQWAEAHDLPVFQPGKVGPAELLRLGELQPDLSLVMAYGHILRQEFIATPRLGTLNLHTSILPAYRGASPIQTAIAAGENRTGVTLMRMVLELDAGPWAGLEPVAVEPLDTARELEGKMALACPALLARCLPQIAGGVQAFAPQDESRASYCRRLEKSDGVLDFQASAPVLAGRINGLAPWPGCKVEIQNQTVTIGLADALPEGGLPPGVLGSCDANGLLVGTGRGTLRLRRLQRPGGRMLAAAEFLRGFPLPPGTQLPSRPMPALVSDRPFPRRKI